MENSQNQEVSPIQQAKQTLLDAMDIAIQKGCFNIHQTKEVIIALEVFLAQPDIQFGQIHEMPKSNGKGKK